MASLAAQELLAKGITSAHDAGVGFETVDLYRAMIDAFIRLEMGAFKAG